MTRAALKVARGSPAGRAKREGDAVRIIRQRGVA